MNDAELHQAAVDALERIPAPSGVTVVTRGGRLIAERDAGPGGAHWFVVPDAEPFAFPDPPVGGKRVGHRHLADVPEG